MTYDASDGTTLTELIRLVRVELDDFPQHIHDTDQTGDGVKTDFRLYDHPYETDGVEVTSAGTTLTEDTDYTVDYDSGWLTFTTAPAAGAALVFDYINGFHDTANAIATAARLIAVMAVSTRRAARRWPCATRSNPRAESRLNPSDAITSHFAG